MASAGSSIVHCFTESLSPRVGRSCGGSLTSLRGTASFLPLDDGNDRVGSQESGPEGPANLCSWSDGHAYWDDSPASAPTTRQGRHDDAPRQRNPALPLAGERVPRTQSPDVAR